MALQLKQKNLKEILGFCLSSMKLQECHNCGGQFEDSQMADWTICFPCKQTLMEEAYGEPVYLDGLGIAWTAKDLEEAGGRVEVDRMAHEADVRNK